MQQVVDCVSLRHLLPLTLQVVAVASPCHQCKLNCASLEFDLLELVPGCHFAQRLVDSAGSLQLAKCDRADDLESVLFSLVLTPVVLFAFLDWGLFLNWQKCMLYLMVTHDNPVAVIAEAWHDCVHRCAYDWLE